MARLVTVFGTKGGIGKTTTAIAIAAVLADCLRVLLIDLDPQDAGSARFWLRQGTAAAFDHTATRDPASIATAVLHADYDLIVCDTPRSDDPTATTALAHSDLVICPSSTSRAELIAATQSSRLVPPHVERRVLLTRVDARSARDLAEAKAALDDVGLRRFEHVVHQRKAHVRAQDAHLPITDLTDTPSISAAADYRPVAAEVAAALAAQLAGTGA